MTGKLLLWSLLLALQAASGTWVARARNGTSFRAHALASVCSNLIWFGSQVILVDQLVGIRNSNNLVHLTVMCAVYVLSTATGSVASHYLLLKRGD